jgi:hypothetical protein
MRVVAGRVGRRVLPGIKSRGLGTPVRLTLMDSADRRLPVCTFPEASRVVMANTLGTPWVTTGEADWEVVWEARREGTTATKLLLCDTCTPATVTRAA